MNSRCSKSFSCINVRSNNFHTNQVWILTIDTLPKIENNEKDSNEIKFTQDDDSGERETSTNSTTKNISLMFKDDTKKKIV